MISRSREVEPGEEFSFILRRSRPKDCSPNPSPAGLMYRDRGVFRDETAMRRVEVCDGSMLSLEKENRCIELRICHSGLVGPARAYAFFICLLENAQVG